MHATKPHLTYEAQLKLLTDRGLTNSDPRRAIAALKRIGYYRFSAYTYPFRRRPAVGDVRVLLDEFESDATFEDALSIYGFDEKLRSVLLEGLNAIEVGLGVQVGYVLGKRDPLGHIGTTHLDSVLCDEVAETDEDGTTRTKYEVWRRRYDKLRNDAREEEYVKHHILHHGGKVPVWVATEFMDFGCLIRLYALMRLEDKKKIAENLGIKREGHAVLFRWLKALNILRNHTAHSNRVRNRTMVDAPPQFPNKFFDELFHHVNSIDNPQRLRLYSVAAIIGYLLIKINPATQWPRSFKTQAKKLGDVKGRTVETEMGFPEGWQSEPLWNWTPAL